MQRQNQTDTVERTGRHQPVFINCTRVDALIAHPAVKCSVQGCRGEHDFCSPTQGLLLKNSKVKGIPKKYIMLRNFAKLPSNSQKTLSN